MISERPNQEQPSSRSNSPMDEGKSPIQPIQQESLQAALAPLLGPETDYQIRVRATRRIAKQGPGILPLLLTTLSNYPEITTPAWPWWPPQYEHSGRLLLYLAHKAQVSPEDMLSSVTQPAGPVLWISIIEATNLLPDEDHEPLLCQALSTVWQTVRYSAAMALATRASTHGLHKSTIDALLACLAETEVFSLRLTAAYALISNGKESGLPVLIQAIDPTMPDEVRKAATLILGTEISVELSHEQRTQLTTHLIGMLYEPNLELAQLAAHALSRIAQPVVLPKLSEMLFHPDANKQVLVLTTLEELASQPTMRRMMRQYSLPTRMALLLRSHVQEVRRQASYTLAACGGEYVAGVFGTILLNKEHPGYLEAVEGLRLLQDALYAPVRINIVRWLLRTLLQAQEEIQVTALDSLAYLLQQARTQGKKQAWYDISQEIFQDGTVLQLLHDSNASVRQRTLELLNLLDGTPDMFHEIYTQMLRLLHTDGDSRVRACVASLCSRCTLYWTIPDLIQALLDPDEEVVKMVFHSLSQLTTTAHPLFRYIVKELTYYGNTPDTTPYRLAQEARTLLKKWQKEG